MAQLSKAQKIFWGTREVPRVYLGSRTVWKSKTAPPANGHTLVGWSGANVEGAESFIVGTWMARDSWDGMAGANWLSYSDDFKAYVSAYPARAADVGVPLVPHDSSTPLNSLFDEALSKSSTYDSLGRRLAELGPDTVYARLYWEMNMSPYPAQQIDRAKFKNAWRAAVPSLRAGFAAAARPGQVLKIVFCPLSDGADYKMFYPGSDMVDVIGLDVYGSIWTQNPPSVSELLSRVRVQLETIANFAKSEGKRVALGEWSNWTPDEAHRGQAGSKGCGDCPEYIDLIFDWAASNATGIAAEALCYYNIAPLGPDQTLATTPKSRARFIERSAALKA